MHQVISNIQSEVHIDLMVVTNLGSPSLIVFIEICGNLYKNP